VIGTVGFTDGTEVGSGVSTMGLLVVVVYAPKELDKAPVVRGAGVGSTLEVSSEDIWVGCDSNCVNDIRGVGVRACPEVIIGRGTAVPSVADATCCSTGLVVVPSINSKSS
jgi:hypothetical protein